MSPPIDGQTRIHPRTDASLAPAPEALHYGTIYLQVVVPTFRLLFALKENSCFEGLAMGDLPNFLVITFHELGQCRQKHRTWSYHNLDAMMT